VTTGIARSTAEMHFVASLEPCPKCGAPTGQLDLSGDGNRWTLYGKCPSCATVRSFTFATDGYPVAKTHPRLELGGPEPSTVLSPSDFQTELERLMPFLRDDPATLDIASWKTRSQLANRALTCLLELRKFPAAKQPEHTKGWYERVLALTERFTADAPRTWLVTGNGKLHPSAEVRALLNQASSTRPLTVADLERWLSIRRDLAKDSAASDIRVWSDGDGVHAELTFRHGTLDDLTDAFPKLPTSAPSPIKTEVTAAGHRVAAVIEHADKRVSKVTLHFSPVN